MSGRCGVGNRDSRYRATRWHCRAALAAALLSMVSLRAAPYASAHQSPVTCTGGAGAGAAIVPVTPTGASLHRHGDEICFQVQLFNTCINCCDVTELSSELVLPDGAVVPITLNADLLWNDSFLCPGDERCATASNCTIPGETACGGEPCVGYRYVVNHLDEHGETGALCPPTPAPGIGEASVFFHATAGIVHSSKDTPVNLCKAAGLLVSPGCCEEGCDPPPNTEVLCGDEIDNDCDGLLDCFDADCAINTAACPNGQVPTVSAWGMVVMTLSMLISGTIVLRRGERG